MATLGKRGRARTVTGKGRDIPIPKSQAVPPVTTGVYGVASTPVAAVAAAPVKKRAPAVKATAKPGVVRRRPPATSVVAPVTPSKPRKKRMPGGRAS